jgi:hypothetical protein
MEDKIKIWIDNGHGSNTAGREVLMDCSGSMLTLERLLRRWFMA